VSVPPCSRSTAWPAAIHASIAPAELFQAHAAAVVHLDGDRNALPHALGDDAEFLELLERTIQMRCPEAPSVI
jgi:hypothetical protein